MNRIKQIKRFSINLRPLMAGMAAMPAGLASLTGCAINQATGISAAGLYPGHLFLIVESFIIVVLAFLLLRREKQRRAEAGLTERFRSLFLLAPVPMAFVSLEGKVLYLNRRFTAVTGYGTEDIHAIDDLFRQAVPDPQSRREALASWEKMTQGDDPVDHVELHVACRDGSACFWEMRTARLGEIILACFVEDQGQARVLQ